MKFHFGNIAPVVSFFLLTVRHSLSAPYSNEKAESPLPDYEAVGLYTFSALSTLVAPVVIVSFKHRSDSVLEDFRQTSRKSVGANYITGDKSPLIYPLSLEH